MLAMSIAPAGSGGTSTQFSALPAVPRPTGTQVLPIAPLVQSSGMTQTSAGLIAPALISNTPIPRAPQPALSPTLTMTRTPQPSFTLSPAAQQTAPATSAIVGPTAVAAQTPAPTSSGPQVFQANPGTQAGQDFQTSTQSPAPQQLPALPPVASHRTARIVGGIAAGVGILAFVVWAIKRH